MRGEVTMSKSREIWLKHSNCEPEFDVFTTEVAQTKPDFNNPVWNDFKSAVCFIELTPEVSRKLELFDEAVELLKESYGSVRTHAMQTYSKSSAKKADEIETFLKKLGE